MAVKTNKILPFAVNAESNDLLSDDEYQKDVTRTGGNIVGIAKRRPNNKALKQASLIASALADIIARGSVFDGSKDDGYDIDDSLDRDTIAEYLFNTFTGIIKETSAGDETLVHIANVETITGAKTFTSRINAQGGVGIFSDPAGDNDAARKAYIDNNFTLLPVDAITVDANEFTTPRRFACTSSVVNLPVKNAGFMDIYKARNSSVIIQVYYLNNNSAIYARTSTDAGSTWGEWKLQTVSDLSAYVQTVNNVAPDKSGNVNIEIPDFVPSGTKMLFYEAAAPIGWTIDTSVNDVGVRIVSSNGGGVSGSTAFSSIFKSGTIATSSTSVTISGNTGNKALTVAMLASHNHGIKGYGNGEIYGNIRGCGDSHVLGTYNINSTGSNGNHNHTFSGSSSHSHNITLNLKYINVIVCSKN